MDIRIFQSGKGDCLQLTHGGNGKHILIDGGVFDAYKDHWAPAVGRLRNNNEAIDLVCISHIDRDHIGGILRMLDNEVAWRLHEFRNNRARSASSRRRNRQPRIARPPEIKNIWHNAFLESVRASRRALRRGGVSNATMDFDSLLLANASILAGAGDSEMIANDGTKLNPAELAEHYQFLGQSVGDAIEVSRRIGADQLNIPLNKQYSGKFVVRRDQPIRLADFSIQVLGPTISDMRKLLTKWNEWLDDKADFLRTLQRRHDRDAESLRVTSSDEIVDLLREFALGLAGNQTVTPPNLASIVMLVSDGSDSILLTGDADDKSIVDGLEAAGLVDDENALVVDVFKVPHHGAHNSYSNDLARSVIAKNYVFCGNGEHSNPEEDIIKSYIKVLFEGDDEFHPALGPNDSVKFWFNSGPRFFSARSELGRHWRKVERILANARSRFGRRFQFSLMSRGDSFLVR